MKTKYLGILLAIGVIGAGSLTVFAKTNNVETISANVVENPQVESSSVSNLYDEIKQMIDQKVEAGALTEEEGQALLEYCTQQMREACNNNTQANGCR